MSQPPVSPKRLTLWARMVGALKTRLLSSTEVVPHFTCSHRYANGTSAWSACWWNGSAWVSQCSICKVIAYCR